MGRRLFESAFTGGVASAYRTSMAVATERGESVQIALRLTAPGLAALPWEALYDPETQRYLCRKDPLVRNVPAPTLLALQITAPLRVLGMISSPRGLPTLDVELERERLEEALKPHIETGGSSCTGSRSVVGRAPWQAPRAGVARAALHRPRNLRHRHG